MQVEGQHVGCLQPTMATGARVSNAYPTFRTLGNSLSKERLMPDGFPNPHERGNKDSSVCDGDASH